MLFMFKSSSDYTMFSLLYAVFWRRSESQLQNEPGLLCPNTVVTVQSIHCTAMQYHNKSHIQLWHDITVHMGKGLRAYFQDLFFFIFGHTASKLLIFSLHSLLSFSCIYILSLPKTSIYSEESLSENKCLATVSGSLKTKKWGIFPINLVNKKSCTCFLWIIFNS